MQNFNLPKFLLATLVVLMFCLVGVAISYESILFIVIFILLGFLIMGYGIATKRKSDN
ncbi:MULTISPECIES: DUF5325 family protein [unclassified Pseudogracilibacillus]|uniref:YlaF family protein n=1 Tax=Candidatus Pseudogracilibacillus intestinigallinarum TaxID=2838742 RepID=A0A9D1PPG7_9BACI|nr:YlaF family protein [Candidatus Pseudogracilibacillus intestinigallinarum]